ncbi:Na/Pi symporter [Sulfurovum sp. XGS-02]|uniref:Na/Pi cotransporter family protein n=1 Tax=Sulfurovum sp. XGS-02 TaxID=2925411 RepID=UPI00204C4787|nr:Na/Pi symporter [Sulfurovum sp. XGS-02]UPT76619.1 Na/Pi symporter [Sulfurovum sp. XGS-02]
METLSILTVTKALGGLGLFLLGMIVMTEGLHALAGDTIRNALMRFTKSPYSGAATGAISTALLQSSSATTVAAVGFVAAGLMSFSETLGIIFGANIGTTITGWMVALLGFKLHLGTIVLPVILMGVLFKLFFKDKIASFGYASAGFGLIFVGISVMQESMSGFEGIITPEHLPSGSWIDILKLVGLGILATLITQSSSAGVAATLTALYANAIHFEQAAALVIGMDVGTTVTALMATVGGSVNVRRTGFSHVIYNLFTAMMALLLITPYIYLWNTLLPGYLHQHAEIALVAFHSSFNILGVLIVLPFTHHFAHLMEEIIPSKEPVYTEKLDKKLLKEPHLALEAARISAQDQFTALLRHINFILGDTAYGKKCDLTLLKSALDKTYQYVDEINPKQEKDARWKELISLIHLIDHAQRLHERCEEEEYRAILVQQSPDLYTEDQKLISVNNEVIDALSSKRFSDAKKIARTNEKQIGKSMLTYRNLIAEKMANDEITIPSGRKKLESARWMTRVTHHISRITYHMEKAVLYTAK